MRDGKPRYLTALGESNKPQGWRENKRDGGVMFDMAQDRVVARGLSMPHSPRWYDNRLWVLESGRGKLVHDRPENRRENRRRRACPASARGLDFIGPVAFIGLRSCAKRMRSPTSRSPTTTRTAQSGVWAVHIGTGNTIGLLKFTGGVQEIFAVQALPGILFPEIIHEGEHLGDVVRAARRRAARSGFSQPPTEPPPAAPATTTSEKPAVNQRNNMTDTAPPPFTFVAHWQESKATTKRRHRFLASRRRVSEDAKSRRGCLRSFLTRRRRRQSGGRLHRVHDDAAATRVSPCITSDVPSEEVPHDRRHQRSSPAPTSAGRICARQRLPGIGLMLELEGRDSNDTLRTPVWPT